MLKRQETVMVLFGMFGGEEICLRDWQIIGGVWKYQEKNISVRKPMFVF